MSNFSPINERTPYIEYCVNKLPEEKRAEYKPSIELLILSAERLEYAKSLAELKADAICEYIDGLKDQGMLS